jgi:hypothetical protein
MMAFDIDIAKTQKSLAVFPMIRRAQAKSASELLLFTIVQRKKTTKKSFHDQL